MRRGPQLKPIMLTPEESARLAEWTRRHKTSQALALRARIVLSCQEDRSNGEIAQHLRIAPQTVGKWRRRFERKRLDGLLDEPRPGAPRTIEDAVVEKVIAKTLHEKPSEATHWSSHSMAKASGLSQTAHRAETLKLSTDPLFIEKVRDIVGLYLNPSGSCDGVVRRREKPNPGAGSYAADFADDARGA
jgi:transposase